MHVLSLIYEYPPLGGGGGVVAAALNAALVDRGHTVAVITSAFGSLPQTECIAGVTVHRTACRRRVRHYTTTSELMTTLWPAYREACRLVQRQRPDLIHVHFALPSGVVAYLLAKRFGIPYVLTTHGSDIPGYNPDRFGFMHALLEPVWRRVLANAAVVTSPSRFLAGLIRRHEDFRVEVIPNGYSPMVGPAADEPSKRNLVLVVARLFPRKGVQHFIDAVPSLPDGWEYVIAGDGPRLEPLKAHARSVGARVRFTGFLDREALSHLYRQARIFAFPSLQENFPMVLLEAMDAGCAIVTTDADGCAEVVGEVGVVIPRNSSAALGMALAELMRDPDRCASLGAAACARAADYRWPHIAAAYEDCFKTALRLPVETPVPTIVPAAPMSSGTP